MKKTSIAVMEGKDPSIMQATLSMLQAAGANLEIHTAIPILLNNSEDPISFNTYVTIYPCVSYFPFVATQHPDTNLVIVRERAEDVYTGIEYPETPDLCIATKLTSRAGSEKTIRYAFEYAKQHRRKKVTLLVQDSILKVTDGLFHKIFNHIAESYPDILNETLPVDIGAAKLAQTPEIFDVIVTSNLYGDILSKIAVYPMGLQHSANIGENGASFHAKEASGLLLASLQMLEYMGQSSLATHLHNAWAYTLEQGIHTPDIFQEGLSKQKVDVKEFSEVVIRNLGKGPEHLSVPLYHPTPPPTYHYPPALKSGKLVGIDVYIYFRGQLSEFISKISHINVGPLRLKTVFNRGNPVWPKGSPDVFCIEEWCCRFLTEGNRAVVQDDLIKILHAIDHVQIPILRSAPLSVM